MHRWHGDPVDGAPFPVEPNLGEGQIAPRVL
jgi:hypothetical protein